MCLTKLFREAGTTVYTKAKQSLPERLPHLWSYTVYAPHNIRYPPAFDALSLHSKPRNCISPTT